jgi:hypothetical protein
VIRRKIALSLLVILIFCASIAAARILKPIVAPQALASTLHSNVEEIWGGADVGGGILDPWPDAVILLRADATWCTGVLISPTAVATAAHCLCEVGVDKALEKVRFGTSPSNYNNETEIDIPRSQKLTACKDFIAQEFPATDQDLAVVFLKKQAIYAPRPIADSSLIAVADAITMVGFGNNDPISGGGQVKRYAAHIKFVSHDCTGPQGAAYYCHPNMEMVVQNDNAGICIGDSGGPA